MYPCQLYKDDYEVVIARIVYAYTAMYVFVWLMRRQGSVYVHYLMNYIGPTLEIENYYF